MAAAAKPSPTAAEPRLPASRSTPIWSGLPRSRPRPSGRATRSPARSRRQRRDSLPRAPQEGGPADARQGRPDMTADRPTTPPSVACRTASRRSTYPETSGGTQRWTYSSRIGSRIWGSSSLIDIRRPTLRPTRRIRRATTAWAGSGRPPPYAGGAIVGITTPPYGLPVTLL